MKRLVSLRSLKSVYKEKLSQKPKFTEKDRNYAQRSTYETPQIEAAISQDSKPDTPEEPAQETDAGRLSNLNAMFSASKCLAKSTRDTASIFASAWRRHKAHSELRPMFGMQARTIQAMGRPVYARSLNARFKRIHHANLCGRTLAVWGNARKTSLSEIHETTERENCTD